MQEKRKASFGPQLNVRIDYIMFFIYKNYKKERNRLIPLLFQTAKRLEIQGHYKIWNKSKVPLINKNAGLFKSILKLCWAKIQHIQDFVLAF